MKNTVGIIGFGNMGQAIAQQLKADYQIFVFDKDKFKLKEAEGVNIESDCTGFIFKVATVILAVKPQDFQSLLTEIKPNVNFRHCKGDKGNAKYAGKDRLRNNMFI